ncbi:uncharacterized protein [Aegilops tauschii subsp. strangulata]|uniref:uncharacterized protein n=1 Tax=Aegilops tauschii subsp. strangulata TaxID=200361 RepID=UPI001ABC1CB9|nr:uncharacterized protein LOC120964916 [Aegilops tauschii subsp. strangulata]
MRKLLIRYMVEIFDPSKGRFIVQDLVGEVSLGAVDVECILALENHGLSAEGILSEEGEDVKDRVPPQFLSKTTCNIVNDDLIVDITKNKSADDDFLRRVVLVLLGTVLAPMSSKTVPKQYYALVDDVKRISKINWNAFTLRVLLNCLHNVRKGKHLRQWPRGNLALLQYLYWEKVQPLEGECAFNPSLSMEHLMRNWTEAAASRRDKFDYDHDRGRGNIKIEDNITKDYREQERKVPEPEKPKMKPAVGAAKKSKLASNADEMMKLIMKRCMDYIHSQMKEIPDQVAERLLEKLDQNGVMYKPAAAMAFGNNDADKEVDSFDNEPVIDLTQPDELVGNQNNDDEEKTSAKLNVDKTTNSTDECGATPENPWIIGNSPRAESSDIDISASSIDRMVGKRKGKKSAATAKEDDVISGKRRRTVPKKFESPFALDKPSKRNARALFSDHDVEGSVKDDLTPELIDTAITFVEAADRSEKNMTKRVYYNERGTSVTVESIRPIIDAYQTHLALRISHDRYLCLAWRSKYLVDRAKARDNPKPSKYNMDSALSRAGASFIPLNVGNTHWITVVMHNCKKEFRVFDSLYPLEFSLDTVKALRLALAIDMEEANRITPGKYPDVTKWPITAQMDMPQQEDGNSCGLLVIEVMEHWDGERWTTDFTQNMVNARRRRLVTELVLSPTNTLECVKNKIRDIAKKRKV